MRRCRVNMCMAKMDQQQIRDIMSGRRKGAGAFFHRAALTAVSIPYAAASRLRRLAFSAGVLPRYSADAPVICVGNITTGGTGKTPMVAWLVRQLRQMGRRPAVLTRGYKSRGGISDEAELLKKMLICTAGRSPAGEWSTPVIVNPDRLAGAARAVAAGADVLVMDDGFQHLRLRRDLDIVLIDATRPFGFGHCLPRGLLREPLAALKCAGAIVITRADGVTKIEMDTLRTRLRQLAPNAIQCSAVNRPTALIDETGKSLSPSTLAGRKILAFCGLGNPDQFFATLSRLKADIRSAVPLADHAAYDPSDIDRLASQAARCGAEAMVTTAKDRVKLPTKAAAIPTWTLIIDVEAIEGHDDLLDLIKKRI